MHAEAFPPNTKGDFAVWKLWLTGLPGLENLVHLVQSLTKLVTWALTDRHLLCVNLRLLPSDSFRVSTSKVEHSTIF